MWGFTPHGTVLPGFPIALQGLAYAMPSVGDFDGDGLAEIVIGDLSRRLYKIELAGTLTGYLGMEWRLFQHDLQHTGETGLWEVPGVDGHSGDGRPIHAVPNPFRTRVTLGDGASSWRVYDTSGRFVRELGASAAGPTWDGRTAAGRLIAPGTYLARSSSGASVRLIKLP